LVGAPPGYVGFDQGGLLTDQIRKTPHAVLLLDEIEKAHPDIFNILLQVMDHATLTDAQGRKADFRHVILIMTTNAGAQEMAAAAIGFGEVSNAEKGQKVLEKLFSPEFRNRLDAVVHFGTLGSEAVERVVDKFMTELEGQLAQRRVQIELTATARRWLAERGYDRTFGARPMARLIQDKVKRVLADEMLFGRLKDGGKVEIDATADDLSFTYSPLPPSKLKRRQEETEPA
jgi:ATP-dependent Clp protease ATP-binding subunit ClpA